MKLWRKYLAGILLLLASLSILSGCFDRRELDTLGIVMGVGIDKAQDADELELTVQMANVAGGQSGKKSKSSKDGGSSESSSAYINVSKTGKNINYIIREMQHKMSRKIYVAHNQVIAIGEELAKEGVSGSLDFFARAPEARMTLYVFVVKGKAQEVFNIEPEFEKMPSTELSKILADQKITSHAPIVTEFEFVSNIVSKTTAAVAPLVSIVEDEETKRLVVDGSAVFKTDKMVGELDEEQTIGLLFVQNKVKAAVLNLSIMDTTATIEVRQAKCKVTTSLYTDGSIVFTINVNTTVGLGDQSGSDNLTDPDNVPAMISAAEADIKQAIQSAVNKSIELDADVFGFGEYINRKYPDQWIDMKSRWDELYKTIKVDIVVKAKADGSGRIVKPLTPEGA